MPTQKRKNDAANQRGAKFASRHVRRAVYPRRQRMNKPKFVNKKWLVIAVILLILVTFSFLEEQKSVSARSIVLAISLDLQDDEYEMGIQLLKADQSQQKEFLTYSSKGKTITEILERLSHETGGTVSLCHTLVLVLGNDLLTKDNDKAMRFFVENEELCNNTMVVASKDSPLEILNAKLSNGQGGGYYLGHFLRDIGKDLGVIPMTIKDYIMNRFRIGGCVYLPYVSVEKTGEVTYISVTESFVTDGYNSAYLNEDATKGLSFALNKLKGGELSYEYEDKFGEVDIVNAKSDIKVSKDGKAKIKIKTTFNDKAYVPENIDEEKSVELIKQLISNYVTQCFETCKEQGLDIFYLGQTAYASNIELYKKEGYLQDITLDVSVNVSMK